MNGPRTNVRRASSAFNGGNNPERRQVFLEPLRSGSRNRIRDRCCLRLESPVIAERCIVNRGSGTRQPVPRCVKECLKFARHSRTKRYRLCISCARRGFAVQIGGVLGPSRHFSTAVNHFVTTANSGFKLCSRLWLCRSRCWRAEAEATARSSPVPAPGCWSTPVSPAANFCGE